jgi:hypothetical protein
MRSHGGSGGCWCTLRHDEAGTEWVGCAVSRISWQYCIDKAPNRCPGIGSRTLDRTRILEQYLKIRDAGCWANLVFVFGHHAVSYPEVAQKLMTIFPAIPLFRSKIVDVVEAVIKNGTREVM